MGIDGTGASGGLQDDAMVKAGATAVADGPDAQISAVDGSLSSNELRTRALKGLRSTVIARPMSEVILLGTMIVLARLVSPADYGRFAIASLVAGLALVPVSGLGVALVQYPRLTREHLQAGFAVALVMAVALVALTLLAATVIVTPIFGARTASFTRISALATLIMAFNIVPATLLQRELAIRRLAVLDVSNSAAGAAVSIALAAMGMGGYALVIGGLAAVLVMTVVNWVWAPQPFPHLHRKAARELLRFGLPQGATMIAWVGFGNIDYGIVGARLGPRQAGYYLRAYNVGVVYQTKVSQVLASVGFPMLSRAESREEMARLSHQMVRLLSVLLFPALVLLAVVAPVLIPWLFGPRWTSSVTPTQIMAIGGAAMLALNAPGAVLMAQGRARALLGYGWGHFAFYALIVFIGSHWGIVGVSLAVAVDHTLFLLLSYAIMLHRSGQHMLRRLWDDIGPATTCCFALVGVAVPMSLAISLAHAGPVAYLLVVCSVGGAAYAVVLRTLFRDSWHMMCVFAEHVLPQRPLCWLRRSGVPDPVADSAPVAGGGEVAA